MIVFNLVCANSHRFEGWFASSGDFEQQEKTDKLSCPVCGARQISKAPHAPYVSTSSVTPREREEHAQEKSVTRQYANVDSDLSRMIDYVMTHTEDVGEAFPEEARKIHYQETPERKIRGQASADEVQELREEGVEVVALPVPAYRLGKAH